MAYAKIKTVTARGKTRYKAIIRQKHAGIELPAKAKTFDTESDAQQFIKESLETLNNHVCADNSEQIIFQNFKPKIIFSNVADVLNWGYANRQSAANPYSSSMLSACRQPLKYDISRVHPSELSYKHFISYCQDRAANGASPSTINTEIQIISAALKDAAEKLPEQAISTLHLDTYIRDMKKAGYICQSSRRKSRFKHGEADRLFNKAKQFETEHIANLPYTIIIQLLIETCLRLSELFHLRVSDLDFINQTIRVSNLKYTKRLTQKSPFTAKMTDAGMQLFKSLISPDFTEDSRIFSIKGKTFSKYFAELRTAAGLEDFKLHDLRREGISRKFEQGFSVVHIAKLFTGHQDLSTLTEIYIELDAQNALHKISPRGQSDISSEETKNSVLKYFYLNIKPHISQNAFDEVLEAFLA
ncbi:tyrosine-type recombinase/integrase [Rheinheimera sp. WS51]|uniref:tyrosine-type recombinase/integrase n=1 Tax=Rheinheimera sp. WS51 TaxID=3425886 RepID=UPI003D8BCFC4